MFVATLARPMPGMLCTVIAERRALRPDVVLSPARIAAG
jgi:hypothetical protein